MRKPIACTLVATDLAAQRRRWQELAERTSIERVELPDGLRLVFAAEPGVLHVLEELVAVERECCAFADWTVASRDGTATLEITAEPEAVPVVHGMFA
jgi:hypothetical protein